MPVLTVSTNPSTNVNEVGALITKVSPTWFPANQVPPVQFSVLVPKTLIVLVLAALPVYAMVPWLAMLAFAPRLNVMMPLDWSVTSESTIRSPTDTGVFTELALMVISVEGVSGFRVLLIENCRLLPAVPTVAFPALTVMVAAPAAEPVPTP